MTLSPPALAETGQHLDYILERRYWPVKSSLLTGPVFFPHLGIEQPLISLLLPETVDMLLPGTIWTGGPLVRWGMDRLSDMSLVVKERDGKCPSLVMVQLRPTWSRG
jgi:hypothetical protein